MSNPMQNQFMNFNEPNLVEIIKPFQEKIKQLEKEIGDKDLEIAQLKYKIMQINQFNPLKMMGNPNYQMPNLMNYNQIMMMPDIPKEAKKKKKSKKLNLLFKIEGKECVFPIQCRSDEKMEDSINKFCTKSCFEKGEYKFVIIGDRKAKMDLTVEENGIDNDKAFHVIVKKKNENDFIEEKNENNEYEDDDDDKEENKEGKIIENNCDVKILGEKIMIIFERKTDGKMASIAIGADNTFKDAVFKYSKQYYPISTINDEIIFLYKGRKISLKDRKTLKEIGIKNGSKILFVTREDIEAA